MSASITSDAAGSAEFCTGEQSGERQDRHDHDL